MNALLIHNDNLPTKLVQAFDTSVKFNIGLSQMMQDGFSFDRIAHEFLEKHLKTKRLDAIFIPYTLSNQNYLELSGIRLALHIRLTPEFNQMNVPIVFIGHETKEQIAKLSEFPSFLFTSGIFSTDKFEYEYYLKIYDWLKNKWKSDGELAELTTEEYEGFLNRISINPPSNYLSHHSVDNELSLLRWSEYLKCDEDISEVKLNIKTGLFFKYKKAQNPIQSDKTGSLFEIEGKAKVLLIDDEAQKGWELFYRSLFKTSPSIYVKSLNIDFKLNSKSYIIKEAIKQIETYLPDIILLDLRLCDSDFDTRLSISELTGIKILEKAKEINKGIQVIITTASNKAISLETVFAKGANGFIVKDGDSDVDSVINSIRHNVYNCIKRAEVLKTIYSSLVLSIKNWDAYNLPERRNITDVFHDKLWNLNLKMQVKDFLMNSYGTLENENLAERFTMSVLLMYRVIEMINEYFIIESGNFRNNNIQYNFDIDNSRVPKISNNGIIQYPANGNVLSTKEKFSAIYYKLTGKKNQALFDKINRLTIYRNKVAIHPSKRFKEESLEYLFENDFIKFNKNLQEYFAAVFEFINTLK
jgi:CheY-like chemotaxis protein